MKIVVLNDFTIFYKNIAKIEPPFSIFHLFFKTYKKHAILYASNQTIGAPVTPEERHVANMQINGYENPTYKYFEVKE